MSVPSFLALEHHQIFAYVNAGSVALPVYDYILTFDREIELVWAADWNLTKLLFFIARYSVFADVTLALYHRMGYIISDGICTTTYQATAWLLLWGIAVAELILIVRTWAIWSRDKRVGLGLLGALAVIWAVSSFCLNWYLSGVTVKSMVTIAPPLTGCLITGGNDVLLAFFVLLMGFESAVLGLTAAKMAQMLINLRSIARGTAPPVVRSLYRDGILFYVYLFAVAAANLVVLLVVSRDFADLLVTPQRVLHSLLSARLLLNLREASMRSVRVGSDSILTGEPQTSDVEQSGIRMTAANWSRCAALLSVDDGAWVDGGGAACHQPDGRDDDSQGHAHECNV
ncbi:hypothetical protein PsYK624_162030 [Phanerochaete sordida]|uniref:DUF6533 domain-containing protein n=1 Tax=Phanerochaete sordida TaxID=48140 RepID=A0A9P3LN52_9APHY|nr:hypothetical protein PsYK624_162030 [Phanerochaete sordida]